MRGHKPSIWAGSCPSKLHCRVMKLTGPFGGKTQFQYTHTEEVEYKIYYLHKQITIEDLLYSSGNSTQCSVVT